MARNLWEENEHIHEAQFLATMAVYEALVMPEYGMSIAENEQQLRNDQRGPWA